MTQMEVQIERAEPLAPSLKTMRIPEIAVKLILGGKVTTDGENQFTVTFEGDAVILHEEDFTLAKKVAGRLVATLPRKITPGVVVSAMSEAHRITADEVFSGNVTRVIYYPAPAEASAWYRCVIPSLVLNAGGKVHSYVTRTRIAREALDYDVIVIQLDFSPSSLKFAKALQSMGKKVIFEIDDAFDALEEWHPGYEHFKQNGTQDQVKAMIANADMVTVTTPYLKERYAQYAKRIEIVPNCLPLHDWPKAEPNTGGTFRVLWAGSPSHYGDLAEVGKVLSEFATGRPYVRLVFFGRRPVELDGMESIEFHEWVEFKDFPQKLADLKADVAIAPLSDVPFNHAKSNLRLIQYGAAGYPIIASDVGQYRETGKGLISLCGSPKEWREALEFYYANPNFRKLMAKKSMELAQEYDINRHAKDIEAAYLSLSGR